MRAARIDADSWRRAIGVSAGAIATVLVWLFADMCVLAWAEGVQSDWTENAVRLLNRFGGGMNPALVVAFFVVAGVSYRERRWIAYGLAMGTAGLVAGLIVQLIKHLIGRARPELWLGPSHYAPGSSPSFPRGHTVGAFALAGVLFFGSRSLLLRLVAIGLAGGVGVARILAFRHWASDVTASAFIGLVVAAFAVGLFSDAAPVRDADDSATPVTDAP